MSQGINLKRAIYNFYQSKTNENAKIAIQAYQNELTALKTFRVYTGVIAATSLVFFSSALFIFRVIDKEDSDEDPFVLLVAMVGTLSFLVLVFSGMFYFASLGATWHNQRGVIFLEKFIDSSQ